MYKTKKNPNSKGSLYNAYKLSSICAHDEVEHQDNLIQLLVGCDNDDTFYDKENEGRLKVYIEISEPNIMTSFDLEDFLIECRDLCPQLF